MLRKIGVGGREKGHDTYQLFFHLRISLRMSELWEEIMVVCKEARSGGGWKTTFF